MKQFDGRGGGVRQNRIIAAAGRGDRKCETGTNARAAGKYAMMNRRRKPGWTVLGVGTADGGLKGVLDPGAGVQGDLRG